MPALSKIISLVEEKNGIFLTPEELDQVQIELEAQSGGLRTISLEEQQAILKACFDNFGVFVSLTERCDLFPDPLRFALVSKVLYNFGACDVPSGLEAEVEKLLSFEPRSWWGNPETDDLIYQFREIFAANPAIGSEALHGEFLSSGDLSLLSAMLGNPLIKKSFVELVVARKHPVFENDDNEEMLEDLVIVAQEVLQEES